MKYLSLLIFLLPTTVAASDYCFICKSPAPQVYQKAVVKKPVVINRIVPLQAPSEEKVDYEGIIAEGRALEMALQAIPGIDRDLEGPQWRCFRFSDNTGAYVAQERSVQRAVQTRQVTKTYIGVADVSYRIKSDGTVDFQLEAEQKQQQQQSYSQPSSSYGY